MLLSSTHVLALISIFGGVLRHFVLLKGLHCCSRPGGEQSPVPLG